jgi:hypothetical protein
VSLGRGRRRGGTGDRAAPAYWDNGAAASGRRNGFCYFLVSDVSSIGSSHAIASGPSLGPQNILLMGLESRRDWNGNILPDDILAKFHVGSRQGVENGVGGNDTNTLILIHKPAGGAKAVGFSIPRDDWVSFAGTVGPQQQVPSGSVASGHVEVLLAASATVPQITASAKPQASSAVVVPNTGPQGGAVGGKGGIPCVN